ncbi:MAG: AMP-binding protein, partial [Kiloniellales bacterium]|nr:AMP-binding protein [Kiloniellales bacterium]
MDYQACKSLTAMFFEQAARLADKPFLWVKRGGSYEPITWRAVEASVRSLSLGLRQLGLAPGERVVLVSENRPEWLIADLAIMAAGAVSVPAYVTNTKDDHAHILGDSGAVGAIVSTRALAARLQPAAMEAADCRWLVAMEPLEGEGSDSLALHAWDAVIAAGEQAEDDIDARVAEVKRDDVACFIYTSGTGG